MGIFVVVPQKPLAIAKSRLAPAIGPGARAALSLTLLRRVCAVLRTVPAVEDLTIMSPDPVVRSHAAGWGVASCADRGADLNDALAEAIAGTARARRRDGILIIAGDLPWLCAADVTAMLGAVDPDTFVLAPSKDGTGTNALLVPPGVRFRPAYGEGSRAAHRDSARARGLRVIEVYRPGLAFDVDTPDDFMAAFGRKDSEPWVAGFAV